MKVTAKTFRKPFVYIFSAILGFVVLIMVFISPFAKYWIQKNDEQLLGRRVEIGWVYVNPFTGYVYIHDLRVFEATGDSIFLTAKGASANFAMLKLFSRTVEISQLTVDNLEGSVIQNKKELNFDDLITRFSGFNSTNDSINQKISCYVIGFPSSEWPIPIR